MFKLLSFKKLFIVASAAIFAVSMSVSQAFAEVKEGVDYVVLEEVIPGYENTLFKVFSYDCPFCYKYDKSVTPKVVEKIAPEITYSVWHLKNKGKYGTQASELFAALIAKDTKAGIGLFDDKSTFKKAKFAYYAAYHDKKERWDAGADAFLKTGLDAAGITMDEFKTLLATAEAQAMLKQWEKALSIAEIQGVPAFVVNGKYLLYTKNIKSIDTMAAAIKELAAKK